ncbi:CidA/LrgA family protein [Halioxenophilus aromaticivorans]|uniref:CidA/LrgA family protein n=1 Tax=Halioxenophilus aromaticivorans TaxID=1306992 RepID=A0AAV3U5U5_9ALTE
MLIQGLAWLLLFQCLGEAISRGLGWIVPGPVVGMVLLFAYLAVAPTPKSLQVVSETLIKNLGVMFLPPAAGLYFLPPEVTGQWPALVGALVIGTAISLTLCALVLKWLVSRQ